MVERKALIVYYNDPLIIDKLNNVNVYYKSKKMNYAIVYVDKENYQKLYNFLSNSSMVDDLEEAPNVLCEF